MSAKEAAVRKQLSPELVTEAAAWIARLHGPLRTPAVEKGLRHWLEENPDHLRAFELVTESWDEVPTLRRGVKIDIRLPSDRPSRHTHRRFTSFALAASLFLLLGAGLVFFRDNATATGIGEQRLLSLEDGSRIYLNTATRVIVDYNDTQRRVRLETGEALFEVAKDAARPFIVKAGDREVTALGTSFLVKRDWQDVAVTLIEGKVTVNKPSSQGGDHLLSPGERIVFVKRAPPEIDHPVLDKLTAWQRGKVSIDNLTLEVAVAEMNRYNRVPLVIEQPVPCRSPLRLPRERSIPGGERCRVRGFRGSRDCPVYFKQQKTNFGSTNFLGVPGAEVASYRFVGTFHEGKRFTAHRYGTH